MYRFCVQWYENMAWMGDGWEKFGKMSESGSRGDGCDQVATAKHL